MYWLKITEESAETHEKDEQTLSVQLNLASFLTRATRSSRATTDLTFFYTYENTTGVSHCSQFQGN